MQAHQNLSAHQQSQTVPSTTWTVWVTRFIHQKLAHTKILQNFWLSLVFCSLSYTHLYIFYFLPFFAPPHKKTYLWILRFLPQFHAEKILHNLSICCLELFVIVIFVYSRGIEFSDHFPFQWVCEQNTKKHFCQPFRIQNTLSGFRTNCFFFFFWWGGNVNAFWWKILVFLFVEDFSLFFKCLFCLFLSFLVLFVFFLCFF